MVGKQTIYLLNQQKVTQPIYHRCIDSTISATKIKRKNRETNKLHCYKGPTAQVKNNCKGTGCKKHFT